MMHTTKPLTSYIQNFPFRMWNVITPPHYLIFYSELFITRYLLLLRSLLPFLGGFKLHLPLFKSSLAGLYRSCNISLCFASPLSSNFVSSIDHSYIGKFSHINYSEEELSAQREGGDEILYNIKHHNMWVLSLRSAKYTHIIRVNTRRYLSCDKMYPNTPHQDSEAA